MSRVDSLDRPGAVQAPSGFIGKASAVTLAGQGTKILVQLVSTGVLGRLLAPADFGLIGTIAPLLTFFIIFRDLGLTNVAIQRPNISGQEVSNLFWINVCAGCLLALVVVGLGRPVASFYHDDRLAAVVALLASTFVVNGLSAQYLAGMQRQFNIVRLISIDVGSTLLGTAAGIAAAVDGWGYWSLAFIPVVTQSCAFVFAAGTSRWRPGRPRWHGELVGQLRSGAGYAGFNLFNFLSRNLDQILVGRTLGETSLGYYSRAYSLMLIPLSQVTTPLSQVMVPVLSRLANDPAAYRAAYLGMLRRVMFFCCPLIMANVVGADWTIGLLLGPKWAPSVEIYTALSISALVQPVGNSTGWLFISQGRARDMFSWGIFSSAVVVASFLVGLHWGILGLAWCYTLVLFVIVMPALCYWVGRRGPVGFRDLAGATVPFLLVSGLGGYGFMLVRTAWQPSAVVGLFVAVTSLFGAQAGLLSLFPKTRPLVGEAAALTARGLKVVAGCLGLVR